MRFYGRRRELDALQKLWAGAKFEFAAVYGRRRVGKTTLIQEFVRDKPCISFTAVEADAKQNLQSFSRAVWEYTAGGNAGTPPVFPSFEAALTYVFELARKNRIILVIDEYPYAAGADPALASTLQKMIDVNKDNSQLFLILCGSSMSFMEQNVLSYKAPLYGRRTAQFKVLPFDFFDSRAFLDCMPPDSAAEIYGAIGGIPLYLQQINPAETSHANLRSVYLDTSKLLFEEPMNLLKQETREAATYNSVIRAIADGCSRLSDIANATGMTTSACSACLNNLSSLGIVCRQMPFGSTMRRKTLYAICDSMFRFWYTFIFPHISLIERGMSDVVYGLIQPQLSRYMGKVFEEICCQYLWRLNAADACPMRFVDLGRWWGTDPQTRRQEEIDIVGKDAENNVLIGECKWTNDLVDRSVVEVLQKRGRLVAAAPRHYFLFAKTGFTAGCRAAAKKAANVHLIALQDMCRFP